MFPCNDAGGYRRYGKKYIYNGKEKIHIGTDLNAPYGTDIVSIMNNGEVIFSGQVNGFGGVGIPGGVVVIKYINDFGGEFTALFGHLDNILVEKGDMVSKGQKIAEIGHYYIGSEDFPHCHFGIHDGPDLPSKTWGYRFEGEVNGWLDPIHYVETYCEGK